MKSLFKRSLAVLMALLILLTSTSIMASAISVGDTVKITGKSEWIAGCYYDFSGTSLGTHKYGQHQHLHTADGRPAYCVEPNEIVDETNKTVVDIFTSLSTQSQKRITAAYIYGYNGNTRYGQTWQTEYVATQAIVWAIVLGHFNAATEESFLAHAFGGSTSSAVAASCRAVYSNIKSQILSHYTIPSFAVALSGNASAKHITLRYNSSSGLYEGTVTDSNDVLRGYTFSYSGVTFSKSGNTLRISTNRALNAVTVSGERTSNDIIGTLPAISAGYAVGSGQTTAVAVDLKDPVPAFFSLSTESVGSIKIVKHSEDGKIANIPFTITGNGVNRSVRTGSDGTIIEGNLNAGTYTVTESVSNEYEPQSSQTVTVVPGQTATVTFNNSLKRGSVVVTKSAEDGLVEGHRFHLYGTAQNGVSIDTYAVTDSSGTATFSNVLIGNNLTLEEVDTGIQYVIPSSQNIAVSWNSVTSTSFSNILKKFTLTVVKSDSVTGSTAQGDGTLEGAVYGVYKGGTLLDTYTTDANGSFTTKEYVCGDDYTLKELTASRGYLVDDTVYPINAAAGNFTVEHNPISLSVTETVISGKIAIIKHSDNGDTQIETPEVNAEFEVYLKSAGSYAAAHERERDLLVTDENGFAISKDLPFGVYIVHQTKGNDGAELIPEFSVTISNNGEIYRYIINNAPFESYLKFVKLDAETGNTVPVANTGIQLYDPSGNLITMSYMYPTPTTIDTFYTNDEGYLITPEKLAIGEGYTAVEVLAPYGYLINTTPVSFDITPATAVDDNGVKIVTVSISDRAQKGTINITKLGEVFSSVVATGGAYIDDEGNEVVIPTMYKPVYEVRNCAGSKFKITAAEDIITPDGTVRVPAGTVVDEITVGETTTKSKQLYLGKYLVQETEASYGMVIDSTIYEVEIVYAGQNVNVASVALTVTNQRQRISINLSKVLEKDDLFDVGNGDELSRVQFALYAAEDLVALDGTCIPADSLLDIVSVNGEGKATFSTDIPIGSKVYVKEYATDEHYLLNEEEYVVELEYAGQALPTASFDINDGIFIENTILRGNICGTKRDADNKLRSDVIFGLFRADETEFTVENAIMTSVSDENGFFAFLSIPYGDYLVKELSVPEDLVINDTPVLVNIREHGLIEEVEFVNDFVVGALQITKRDVSNGNLLPNVWFRLRDEGGNIIAEGCTNEDGIAYFGDLRYGKYTYQEFLADGFIVDNREYPFEITENGQLVEVVMTNEPIPVPVPVPTPVIPKTGSTNYVKYLIPVAFVSAATLCVTGRKRKEDGDEE